MKQFVHILSYLLLPILVSIFWGCSMKDELDPSVNSKGISNMDIEGTWINTLVSWDTIHIHDTIIERWDDLSNRFAHFYTYKILTDSVFINYTGLYKVGTPPYHRKIYLNSKKDTLIIQNFHAVYPGYQGDIFVRTSK